MAVIAMIFTISAIKSPRLCVSVTEEETVFNASPYTFFNYDNDKPEHEAIERVLFSMDTYIPCKRPLSQLRYETRGKRP